MALMDEFSCSGMCDGDCVECLRMCGVDDLGQDVGSIFHLGYSGGHLHHHANVEQPIELRNEPDAREAPERLQGYRLLGFDPGIDAYIYESNPKSAALYSRREDPAKWVVGDIQYTPRLGKGLKWLGKFGIWLGVGLATFIAASVIGTILSEIIYPLAKQPTW